MHRWENSSNLAAQADLRLAAQIDKRLAAQMDQRLAAQMEQRLTAHGDYRMSAKSDRFSSGGQPRRGHVSRTNSGLNSLRELENLQKVSATGSWSTSRSVGGVVKRRKHIVILGLDGSGKTTILMRLKFGCAVTTAPTIGFNHEKLWSGGYRWSAWDVGGGEKARPLWATYTRATDGIVFVVDASAPHDSIEESRVELSRVVKISSHTSHQLNLSPPPILVLANFQDCMSARSPEDIAFLMGLSETWASSIRWAVAPVCGLTGEGLDGAFMSLRALIDTKRKENRKEKSAANPPRWRW